MRRPLTIVGASVRAAASSAKRAGFQPFAIDLFADRDLAAECPAVKVERYPLDFLAALAAAPEAPWIYTGGLENFPHLVDRLAAIRPLLGNRGHVLRAVRDPWRLADAVRECRLPFPRIARSPSEATEAGPNIRWLVKPRRGSGGLAIHFTSQTGVADLARGTYWQECIEGQAASAVYVAMEGRATLLGASRQLLGGDFGHDRPFLYVGSLAPLILRAEELSQLAVLGGALAERFNLQGLFNVDFVRTANELWPLEVNPRYSASVEVLERVTGFNFMEMHVAACERGILRPPPLTDLSSFAGKAVVYAPHEIIVRPRFDLLVGEWNLAGQPPGIADLPAIGQRLAAGRPVATVFAAGSTSAEVERTLRERVAAVSRVIATEDGP
jgi:uncharacterized protein